MASIEEVKAGLEETARILETAIDGSTPVGDSLDQARERFAAATQGAIDDRAAGVHALLVGARSALDEAVETARTALEDAREYSAAL